MKTLLCMVIGYLIGSFNPALIISKIKKKDIRETGTGNLGATNTMIHFGKGLGTFVMLFDFFKAVLAVYIAKALNPASVLAGLLAGVSAVLGHMFPFYLKGRGGKGLASFGGLVLAVDPPVFLFLLVLGLALMLIVNYSYVMPFSAGSLFPVLYGLRMHSFTVFAVSAIIGALVIFRHYENLGKAKRGEDFKVRDFLKKSQKQ